MRNKFLKSFFLGLGSFLLTGIAQAQTVYYVDGINGSDLNPGTSPGAAFATIQRGVDVGISGDTVNVLPAVYPENVVIDKDGLSIEAMPTATVDPMGGVAFEIDASLEPITNATVVRGFLIDDLSGFGSGTGFDVHNDRSFVTDFDVSPIIKNNTILNMGLNIIINPVGFASTCEAVIEHNFIQAASGVCAGPLAFGIFLNPENGSDMDVVIRQNEIYYCEFGIGLFNTSFGVVEIFSSCNSISQCEWGILLSGGVDNADFVNETIAFGNPASPGLSMQGIQVEPPDPDVSVYNSIVWIPDDGACLGLTGTDLIGFGAGGAFINSESIVFDDGDPDPMFTDPTPGVFDFTLMPTSPAIDAGDTSIVAPPSPTTVSCDNRGESRVLSANFDNIMEVDVGAHEFTQLTLDFVEGGYPGYTGDDEPCVSALMGSTYTFTIDGPANGTAYLIYNRPPTIQRLLPNLGYMKVPLGVLDGPFSLAGGPVTWSFSFPLNNNNNENVINYQGVVLVPFAGGGPRTGNFTRLVEVELNQ